MFRVFKVTSPMSVGCWVLLVSGGASSTAAVARAARDGSGRCGAAASCVVVRAGPPLATYTGALLANTANPVWHEGAATSCPWLFGASAAASAGAAAVDLHLPAAPPARHGGSPSRGVLVESRSMQAMERRLGFVGEVYGQGRSRQVSGACRRRSPLRARRCSPWRGTRSRAAAVTGGALVLAGELGPALVGVQGRLPVGAQPGIRCPATTRSDRARGNQGDDKAALAPLLRRQVVIYLSR